MNVKELTMNVLDKINEIREEFQASRESLEAIEQELTVESLLAAINALDDSWSKDIVGIQYSGNSKIHVEISLKKEA